MPKARLFSRVTGKPSVSAPDFPLVNMYAEIDEAQTYGEEFMLVPTPGLTQARSAPPGVSGVCRGMLFGGDVITGSEIASVVGYGEVAVYGTTLVVRQPVESGLDILTSRETTLTGSSGTDKRVTIVPTDVNLVLVDDNSLWIIPRNADATAVTDPDLPSVIDAAWSSGYLIVIEQDSQKFMYSAVLDPSNYDALDFALADEAPDFLRAVLVDKDEIFLFGSEVTEIWAPTGDSTLPFIPRTGSTIDKGIVGTHAKVKADNTVFMVGSDLIVYRLAGITPQRVSDHVIEDALQNASAADRLDITMDTWPERGHTMVKIDIPNNGTYVLDVATNLWHQRITRGYTNWRVGPLIQSGGGIIAGDQLETHANAFKLDYSSWLDYGIETVRRFAAFAPLPSTRANLGELNVIGTVGVGLDGSPTIGANPQLSMEYSDDGGQSWSNERFANIGKIGEFSANVRWNGMKRAKRPGRYFRFMYSDPIPFSVYRVTVGEPRT